MAIVEDKNVSWKNIKVNQFTDTITGYTYLTLPSDDTTIIATSENSDWVIKDLNLLTRLYNSGNNLQATTPYSFASIISWGVVLSVKYRVING